MDRYLDFEWDEAKSEWNRLRRDLQFNVAVTMFEGYVAVSEDTRRDYGERRMCAVGRVDDLMVQCVYTMRGDVCRIISLRRANRKERNAYHAGEARSG